jgi:hypothetical protein
MLAFTSSENSLLRLVLLTIALLALTSTTRALPVLNVELDARGATPSKPAQCPSVKDIEAHIKKKAGSGIPNAVYWSHPGSVTDAQNLAKKLKGHYIYDFVSNEDIAAWGKLCSPAEKGALWSRASYAFAKLSTGTAFVVTSTAKSDAIWSKYEYPVLQATGLINTVFSVDPATAKTTQIFTKNPSVHPRLPAEP